MTPQEVRAEWVKRLRSGEYKQGLRSLRQKSPDGEEFCCLGVLCEIAVENGVVEILPPGEGAISYGYREVGTITPSKGFLPPVITNFAGLKSEYGRWNDNKSLVDMNDGQRKTFAEIADAIENAPEGLFFPDVVTA